MRMSVQIISKVAFAFLLMPAFSLFASEAINPATGVKDDKATDPSVAVAADPAALLPAAPLPPYDKEAVKPYSGGPNLALPKIELFMGYTYLQATPKLAAGNRLVWLNGGSTSIAFNLNRYFGIVGDFGGFNDTRLLLTGPGVVNPDRQVDGGTVFTYMGGPRLSYRKYERVTPFAQVLAGGIRASEETLGNCTHAGCTLLPSENAFAFTAGGGFDVQLHHRLSLRVIQAEYMMTRFENLTTGETARQNDMRISSGIVFRFGGGVRAVELPAVTYSCSVNPSSVFSGETVAVSGTAMNLNPAKTVTYTWSVDGGTITGTSSTANIDTKGLAAGTYTVKGHVSEGDKPGDNADCTAPYVVKAMEPPTVSCTASPVTVMPGDPSTITAVGISPQNRPLTYSYSASSGSITGTDSTVTLSTAGAMVGPITITCNVADDKGQTASATTTVTVAAPVETAKPTTSDLCAVHFDRDARRPVRVDNEGKACLDEIALDLQRSPDAKLAIVGNASGKEKGGNKLATARAVNTRTYLVSEKGIDAARITVYSGSQDGKIVSNTLVPAGATFDATGDTPVN